MCFMGFQDFMAHGTQGPHGTPWVSWEPMGFIGANIEFRMLSQAKMKSHKWLSEILLNIYKQKHQKTIENPSSIIQKSIRNSAKNL